MQIPVLSHKREQSFWGHAVYAVVSATDYLCRGCMWNNIILK